MEAVVKFRQGNNSRRRTPEEKRDLRKKVEGLRQAGRTVRKARHEAGVEENSYREWRKRYGPAKKEAPASSAPRGGPTPQEAEPAAESRYQDIEAPGPVTVTEFLRLKIMIRLRGIDKVRKLLELMS